MPAPLGSVPPGGAGGGGLPSPGGRRRTTIPGLAMAIAVLALLAAGGFGLWQALAPEGRPMSARGTLPAHGWEVCFTPDGACTDLILAELGQARHRVPVQAHRRSVEVRVILDRSQRGERCNSGTFLGRAGIPVLVDDPAGIAHNKVMVIDDDEVITGSFDFTRSAQARNAATWERRRAVSRPCDPAPIPAATAHAPVSPKRALDNLI